MLDEHSRVYLGNRLRQRSEIADIDDSRLGTERRLVEATVGKLAVQGHLTAFKARTDARTGTAFLALSAATGGLAMATTLAATNTLFAMDGTGDVCEFVEFHKGFLKKRPALLEKGGGTRI
jgi:hypothetical protein